MGKHERTDVTEADRLASAGAETNARPGEDEVGPVSGEATRRPAHAARCGPRRRRARSSRNGEQRLDPDNRPDGVEVDNSDREFDAEKGLYTDSEGYEQAEEKFPPMGEQGA